MLEIFICEDDPIQRSRLEMIINNFIMIEEFDMRLVMSTDDPYELISYVEERPPTQGVYFLDVDLGTDIDGIQLGSRIRNLDINSKIIFITTHSELLSLTFTYKVEAMDYIPKDDFEIMRERIYADLIQANKHHTSDRFKSEDRIQLKIGSQVRVFLVDEIIFFETSTIPHKLILYTENSVIELYGKINEIETLSPSFFRTHKSYVVNLNHIKEVNKKERELIMNNQEIVLVSVRQLKQLEKRL